MKEYIFGSILIGFIAGIAQHTAHVGMREPTRTALGIITLMFAASPFFYIMGGKFDFHIPSYDFSFEWAEEELEDGVKGAYVSGVARALAEKYGESAECFLVMCDGFDAKTLYTERMSVTLVGRGAFLDYRSVREYLCENLNIGECRVNVEIDQGR